MMSCHLPFWTTILKSTVSVHIQFGKIQLEIIRTWVAFTENSWTTLAWSCHLVNFSPNDKCRLSNDSLVSESITSHSDISKLKHDFYNNTFIHKSTFHRHSGTEQCSLMRQPLVSASLLLCAHCYKPWNMWSARLMATLVSPKCLHMLATHTPASELRYSHHYSSWQPLSVFATHHCPATSHLVGMCQSNNLNRPDGSYSYNWSRQGPRVSNTLYMICDTLNQSVRHCVVACRYKIARHMKAKLVPPCERLDRQVNAIIFNQVVSVGRVCIQWESTIRATTRPSSGFSEADYNK